ncbi:MAG: precorrin-6y C5,15-methyltransferase (decarboxylating) subunit CbiE [Proteobacteria bacterium]|nr:precorrin-6y C5,15-methyltransferase (decarboxylating) subunit CbiE [Pseudomonadota bacterium]
MAKGITVVGCGPGAQDLITLRGRKAIDGANLIIGSPRLLADFTEGCRGEKLSIEGNYREIMGSLEERAQGKKVVILASGDPMLHSFGVVVAKRFGREAEYIPGVSSVQYAFTKIARGWDGYRIFSLHGGTGLDVKKVFRENDRIVILLDPKYNLKYLRQELDGESLTGFTFYIASNLSLEDEDCIELGFEEFGTYKEESLSILIVRKEIVHG